jgi:hypothetical protein
MVNDHAVGYIKEVNEKGEIVILARLPNLERAIDRQYNEVEVIFQDGRRITPRQRRAIFAIIGEIAEFVEGFKNAETIESTKEMLKMQFILERLESMERRLFSLSNVDETTASSFIDFLIQFVIKHDIPTSFPLIEQAEDVGKYIYACAINKRCVICGKKAQWHHAEDRVGMGRDRKEICHIGMRGMPLCEEHHELSHTMPQNEFNEKYHIQSIKVDDKIAKKYKLKHDEVKI